MDYEKLYKEALERARQFSKKPYLEDSKDIVEYIFPELKEDEKISREITEFLVGFNNGGYEIPNENTIDSWLAWLEKQKPQGKPTPEVWKDMRLEVYQQASGNRHEPNYSDDSTKMFSLTDIDEIFEKVAEKQGEQKPFNNDKYQTVSVKILDRLYESEKELERLKQGEQKLADKVEPKFKVGDWIVRDDHLIIGKVISFDGRRYWYNDVKCSCSVKQPLFVNEKDRYHIWTIQDAKDGDVLAFDNDTIVIFKDLYNANTFHSYCYIEDGVFDINENETLNWWESEGFKPATKEQRDILFQKMKEAGYEWDAEQKELKRIEHNPVWSEEDEEMKNKITKTLTSMGTLNLERYHQTNLDEVRGWFESLKDRIQPRQEWNCTEIAPPIDSDVCG